MTGLSPSLPSPTVSASSARSSRVPLLSLAQPAIHLGDELATDDEEFRVGEIWNVISRAADIVKDGDRLENLAWRHWGQPARKRRVSASSWGTESSASPCTPESIPPSFLRRSRSFERRSFGGVLKLLLDHDNFKDWVTDAKSRLPVVTAPSPAPTPPVLSLPDTPIANVEIRLLEPTPVPSRVGSLGGSMSAGGLLAGPMVPPMLKEDEEETIYEEENGGHPKGIKARARSPKRKNRFFINSSPNKGSGSDTSQVSQPSPVTAPQPQVQQMPPPPLPEPHRRSSGESSGDLVIKRKKETEKKKHVPLSHMKGKFAAEKRKAADALQAKVEADIEAEEEEGGWEDEGEEEDEEDWDDEPESPAKTRPPVSRRSSVRTNRSSSNLDLAQLTREISRRSSSPKGRRRDPPPPPAPTPLKRMSKKEKLAAAAEREKIEAELEAQEKRKMFAKRQIFGENNRQNSEGLLTNLFKRGGSMADLTQAPDHLRPSPTHVGLSSLSRSPAPGQNLLRSKSAVAIPVQTGVSVTTGPSGLHTSDERRPPPAVDLESSGEESEDDFLASSSTRRKIAELAAKRDARSEAKVQLVPQAAMPILDPNGIVQPLSPTTRRRTIIMREMSESLRRNIILEREKSAGRRTSFVTSQPRANPALQNSSSALDLSNYSHGAPLERHNSQPMISRPAPPKPHPLNDPAYKTSLPNTITQEPQRRKPQPNVLGGGFLRPLTRVGEQNPLGRVQSSATIREMGANLPQSSSLQYEAPAMQRRATDGPGPEARDLERERVRRELQKRSDTMDTSYRSHGW